MWHDGRWQPIFESLTTPALAGKTRTAGKTELEELQLSGSDQVTQELCRRSAARSVRGARRVRPVCQATFHTVRFKGMEDDENELGEAFLQERSSATSAFPRTGTLGSDAEQCVMAPSKNLHNFVETCRKSAPCA